MATFKTSLTNWLADVWYVRKKPLLSLILLSWLYSGVIRARQVAYRRGLKKIHHLPVPVIVVGNITVGGTGKTPFTIWLAGILVKAGFKPGIISRGYGGTSKNWPQHVFVDSDFRTVGDEALVIARRTSCPMVVGPDRVAAAQALLKHHDCDVIISDDGLQHYALGRDMEISVIDSHRRFGNQFCLPAGPLREPIARLEKVDFTVYNGPPIAGGFNIKIEGKWAVNIRNPSQKKQLLDFVGKKIHVLAGIGNPQRFFDGLTGIGLNFDIRKFPDHHDFNLSDIEYGNDLMVLMTEKDAVKCEAFAGEQHWYVPAEATVNMEFNKFILNKLADKINGRKTT